MSQALGAVRCMLSQNVRKQIQTTERKTGQPVSHYTNIFAFRVHKAKVRGLHVKAQVSQTLKVFCTGSFAGKKNG